MVLPVLMEALKQAKLSNQWEDCFCALDALRFSTEGIQTVIKQKEIKQISDYLVFFLSHSEPRIRYDALDCIAQLTDDFEELGDAATMFLQSIL